jgi:hypothetical protein
MSTIDRERRCEYRSVQGLSKWTCLLFRRAVEDLELAISRCQIHWNSKSVHKAPHFYRVTAGSFCGRDNSFRFEAGRGTCICFFFYLLVGAYFVTALHIRDRERYI